MGGKVYVSLAAVKELIKQVEAGPIIVATETGYKYIENPSDNLIKRIEAIQDTIVSVDIPDPCWRTKLESYFRPIRKFPHGRISCKRYW